MAAVGGLVLGVSNTGWQVWRWWWQTRCACFEIGAEIHGYVSPVNGQKQQHRIMLTNRGSAVARDVSVTALDEDHQPLEVLAYFGRDAFAVFPGQTRYVIYEGPLVMRDLRGVDVAWSDGRRGQQRQRHSVVAIYT
ncbi:MAG: hypothetical protein ACR2FG_15410 [Marmoricola sp.]